MKISSFTVNRPVFTSMVTFIILILGMIALSKIPLDLLPDVSFPRMSITTTYEGASPEEIEEQVTRPLEEALSAVAGVKEISSRSSEDRSRLNVSFVWGTDLDEAANDFRERLDRTMSRLPEEAERPVLRKYNPANFPVIILGVASELDPLQLRRIIDEQVKFRIERVPGVAVLEIRGGLEREIQVALNVDKIKALHVPLDQILDRLKASNQNLPAGSIEKGRLEVRVRTPGNFSNLKELEKTAIAVRDGVPIYLSDLARIEDGSKELTRIVRINGRPGVRLAVRKQSGTNTVQVAEMIMKEVARINRDIPQLSIIPIIDSSEFIKSSIYNLSRAAFFGGILAIFILLIFLQDFRSTLIISVAIPVSVVATFVLIYFGGLTINIMSLGGLALGIGMLLDNSIVVLENIIRHRDSGMRIKVAAINGSEEVTTAIIASTLTTLVVFLPLIFIEGMSGVMFKQLSLVVSFSLLCSLLAAISLIPMLSVKILGDNNGKGAPQTGFFAGIGDTYNELLHFTLNYRFSVIFLCLLLLACSLAIVPLIGTELMPTADEGEVRITGEMEVGTRVEILTEQFERIDRIVRKFVPEMKSSVKYLGGTGWRSSGSHTGQMRISLVSQAKRKRSSAEISAMLRKKLSNIPGLKIRIREGQGFFLIRRMTGGDEKVAIEIRGHDFETADPLGKQVQQIMEDVPGITDTRLSRDSGTPEELVMIDRSKAEAMKLSVVKIASMLQTVITGSRAGYFRESGKEYDILVRVADAKKLSLSNILDLTVTNSAGEPVVLRNVIHIKPRTGPVLINRKDQGRVLTVSANIRGRNMGEIIEDIRKEIRNIAVPEGFSINFGGDYQEQQEAFRELLITFVLAVILVYMVMACQFESLVDPFIVMFSVPMSAIGVLIFLFLSNTTFNIQSFIGCIMLAGIVVNNSILLVDQANRIRMSRGWDAFEAIKLAGQQRLRPILMTALTTILGLLPLAIGMGEGGEAQAPMARSVIGGLLSSTVITLVFIPVIYTIFSSSTAKEEQKIELELAEKNVAGLENI
ncbi:efflux RND transporter permease subunit [Candidatus Riflebacteria bacterium]